MLKLLNIEFEKAVRLLVKYFPMSNLETRKPVLFHALRVGGYLYEHNYPQNIVLAGLLHDTFEFSKMKKSTLRKEFGTEIVKLVKANTKNESITDKDDKTIELIQRCVKNGQAALIIKAADIIDSFKYYSKEHNRGQLQYCTRYAKAILRYKPANFKDKIFIELKSWQKNNYRR